MSYHKVIIAGNLAASPEMRYLPDGTPVTTFRMASNDFGKTTWFRITVWRKSAEAVANHLSTGSSVLVEGKFTPDKDTGHPRVWTDNSGNARAGYEVTADRVVFLSGGGKDRTDEPKAVVTKDVIPF